MTRWEIRGRELGNCNSSYGCPCQFNALPTYGHCRGLAVFEIDEGFHGTTRLDGLHAAAMSMAERRAPSSTACWKRPARPS